MKRKNNFPTLNNWEDKPNYELEYLRMENLKLKQELDHTTNKIDKNIEKDIAALLQISMKMKYLLEQCRSQTMLPIDLGKQIDKIIKEIETYG
jgi:hypothetical protein